ncbi:unnamed protein product [Rangifer tarandus platyrhynchus]|uniref:Uncharacterized protein n=1 Tax=Rangifer tarandus platyrhynchus TaxID=3082113 RepID=A0AC59Z2M4_RANTA
MHGRLLLLFQDQTQRSPWPFVPLLRSQESSSAPRLWDAVKTADRLEMPARPGFAAVSTALAARGRRQLSVEATQGRLVACILHPSAGLVDPSPDSAGAVAAAGQPGPAPTSAAADPASTSAAAGPAPWPQNSPLSASGSLMLGARL